MWSFFKTEKMKGIEKETVVVERENTRENKDNSTKFLERPKMEHEIQMIKSTLNKNSIYYTTTLSHTL